MDEPKPDAPKNENISNATGSTPDQAVAAGGNQTANETPDAVKAELSKMAGSDNSQAQIAGTPSSAPPAQNQSKKSKKMFYLILAAVFLVVAGLGYYLYSRSNSKKPATAQTTSTTPPSATPPASAPQPEPNKVQTEAEDTERQTDINALDSHLEAFYADQGYYPTLTNMNTASWVSTNLKGLDPVALQDPQGHSQTLVSAPQAKAYAYAPTDDSGKACDDAKYMCTKFTLTAVLSTGQQYQKQSH